MSVTSARGFRAAGVVAGLKDSGAADLALVVNEGPSRAAAGVFTRNRVKAAPVLWSQRAVADGRLDAVVLNSGGANACTGPAGFADAHATAEHAAQVLGVSAVDVAVCSTGLIGVRLRVPELLDGVSKAAGALAASGGADAARAIMTTDTVAKEAAQSRGGWTIAGMAKGAGMLAPGLATMLCVLTTDADLPGDTLQRLLQRAVSTTFDRVDSDGCMSTNDTVLLLASGAAGIRPDEAEFAAALQTVCADLCRQLLADAEGATRRVAVEVVRAADDDDAVQVGRAVARSNLFKCAMSSGDANWGRILAAVGTTSARFEPEHLAVAINGTWVCRDGGAGEDRSLVDMSGPDVHVRIDLGAGVAEATVWTNDLTADYVAINADYPT